MKTLKAKAISYSDRKRNRKEVYYIVIHNTANNGDRAISNANYYAYSNVRSAGAHFFIDQRGEVVKSVDLNRAAYAVGGARWNDCQRTGGGKLYGAVTNYNSVSIELCDIIDRDPSDEMMEAIWETVCYIRKYCPNATNIVRHFDVNGKHCPLNMMEESDWNRFKLRLLQEALK